MFAILSLANGSDVDGDLASALVSAMIEFSTYGMCEGPEPCPSSPSLDEFLGALISPNILDALLNLLSSNGPFQWLALEYNQIIVNLVQHGMPLFQPINYEPIHIQPVSEHRFALPTSFQKLSQCWAMQVATSGKGCAR